MICSAILELIALQTMLLHIRITWLAYDLPKAANIYMFISSKTPDIDILGAKCDPLIGSLYRHLTNI